MRRVSAIEPLTNGPVGSTTERLRAAASGITGLDIWAFVLPAISFLEIQLIGRLIISEMIALALLPWLLRSREGLAIPRWLIVLWGAWLGSQVITDLVVHSAFTDWARGWAAIVFTLVDIAAVAALAGTPRRARIFATGLAAGALLGYLFNPIQYAAGDPWKWAFAGAIGLAIAAGMSGPIALRRPWIVVTAFAAFGWLNAAFLYRSLAGVALLTAVYLMASIMVAGRRSLQRPTITRTIAGIALYGFAAMAVFLTLNVAASMNLLGSAAKEKFDTQSGANALRTSPPAPSGPAISLPPGVHASSAPAAPVNPLAVLLGGRAEILASPWAILDSPILGHGSWAKDPKYAQLQLEGLSEFGVPQGNAPTDPNLIPTHSYLLGSWVWAGLAGGLFWLGVIAAALWLIANLYRARLSISPLIVYATSMLLWDIAFSPYGNTARLYAAFGIAMILLGLRRVRALRTSRTTQDGRQAEAADTFLPSA
jgi:hypothetical protein